jgi:hypothetical protein
MALRDQPYLPLYVQDYLTDEKLNQCLASTQGVYIKIMCVMHKSEEYGTILLEQKFKQSDNHVKNFAIKLSKHLLFSEQEIYEALIDLLNEKVLTINGDKLYQKRMVKDNELSIKRSESGKKGGEKTQFAKANFKANNEATSENENENENVIKNVFDEFRKKYPGIKRGLDTEFDNFKKKHKDWKLVVKILLQKIEKQIEDRHNKKARKEFVPEWKNLQTWINQRCWEEETGMLISFGNEPRFERRLNKLS